MRKWIATAALVLAACSGEKTPVDPGPGEPALIVIAAPATTMVVGGTLQLNGAVSDNRGNAIPNAALTWESSDQAVATVSATGLVSAVAPGNATITARSKSASASVAIRVDPDPCSAAVTLAVGEVRTFNGGTTVQCVTLSATTGASDFLIIGANTKASQDDLMPYSLATQSAAAVTSLSAPEGPSAIDAQLVRQDQEEARAEALHERLRSYERGVVAPLIPGVAARHAARFSQTGPTASLALLASAPGDTVTIRVPNLNTGKNICRDNIPIRGVVRAVTSRATIVADIAVPDNGFSTQDFVAIGNEFDNLIFPTDTSWFGKPTDINTDGRITILFTPEVNKLTSAGSSGFVAGFFFGSDLLKKTDFANDNECRNQTNEQEIFYVLAPDPTGQFNNVRSTATVRQGTRGVIAHEFQHMINQGVRQFNPAVRDLEAFWLNEALSHLAEEVVGRALRGFGDFQSLAFSDINPNPSTPDDYQAFFRQNLARLERWMARPDTSAPVSVKNRDQLAPRGASWSLVRYAIDQYSGGSARTFTKALAAGPETDIPNLLARTRAPFDQIITGWLVANFADGIVVNGLAPRFSYLSWNLRDVMTRSSNTFPLLISPLPGSYLTETLSSSGNYFRLTRAAASPSIVLRMAAPGGGPLTSGSPTMIIVRLN